MYMAYHTYIIKKSIWLPASLTCISIYYVYVVVTGSGLGGVASKQSSNDSTMNDESSFLPAKGDNTLTKEQMKDDLITLLDTVNT